MESERVKEIKKALECCSISCADCPYDKGETTNPICINNLTKNALTLINELESENDTLHTNLCEWRKENQQLKDRIAELEKENDSLKGNIVYREKCEKELVNACDECNSKIEKFAERLKEKKHIKKIVNEGWIVSYVEICNDIDETLKECLCDNNQ